MTTFLDMATARAAAESLMSSTCSIAPPGAEPVTDPDTGEVTFPAGVAVYTGPCRVRPATLQAQSRNLGGGEAFVSDVLVSVPAMASGIAKGMVVTIASSPDPALVGLRAEIQDVARGDNLSARRMWCLEVS